MATKDKEKELPVEETKTSEIAKDKELPVEETKTLEVAKESEEQVEKPILVIREKDGVATCVELSPEGYERMQEEVKNCDENKSETLRSVWVGYRMATSEEVQAYKAKAKLKTIFSNE